MNSFLYQDFFAARQDQLLREADVARLAVQASRKARGGLRRRLGAGLVHAGSALLRDPAHSR